MMTACATGPGSGRAEVSYDDPFGAPQQDAGADPFAGDGAPLYCAASRRRALHESERPANAGAISSVQCA